MFCTSLKPSHGGRLPGAFFGLTPFNRDVDRLFDSLFSSSTETGDAGPRVNIHEDDTAVTVEAELPGFTEEEIDLSFTDGVLTLSGSHEESTEGDDGDTGKATIHRREFRKASFERSFRLDREFDEEGFKADFSNGVLRVTLPKKSPEPETVRKIRIG